MWSRISRLGVGALGGDGSRCSLARRWGRWLVFPFLLLFFSEGSIGVSLLFSVAAVDPLELAEGRQGFLPS